MGRTHLVRRRRHRIHFHRWPSAHRRRRFGNSGNPQQVLRPGRGRRGRHARRRKLRAFHRHGQLHGGRLVGDGRRSNTTQPAGLRLQTGRRRRLRLPHPQRHPNQRRLPANLLLPELGPADSRRRPGGRRLRGRQRGNPGILRDRFIHGAWDKPNRHRQVGFGFHLGQRPSNHFGPHRIRLPLHRRNRRRRPGDGERQSLLPQRRNLRPYFPHRDHLAHRRRKRRRRRLRRRGHCRSRGRYRPGRSHNHHHPGRRDGKQHGRPHRIFFHRRLRSRIAGKGVGGRDRRRQPAGERRGLGHRGRRLPDHPRFWNHYRRRSGRQRRRRHGHRQIRLHRPKRGIQRRHHHHPRFQHRWRRQRRSRRFHRPRRRQ